MTQSPIQLLVVEDNPEDVRRIKEFLGEAQSSAPFNLTVAGRLDEALRLLETRVFDVILLDLTLPDAHGLDAVKALGLDLLTTPLIVITGQADTPLAVDVMRAEAQDYLLKSSLTAETLLRSIRNAIERTKIRNALRESEVHHRLLAENITDIIVRHAPDSSIRYVSPSCRTLLGYEMEEMLGHRVDDFFHPDDLPILNSVRELSRRTLNTYTIVYRLRHKDGTYRWFETSGKVTRDGSTGFVLETISVSRDITERHHIEESTRLLQKAMEQTDDAILIMTATPDLAEAQIVFINPAFSRLTGYLPEDLIGQQRRALHDYLLDPQVSKQVHAALARGDSFCGEAIGYHKDGSEYDIEWTIAPIRDALGSIFHYVSVQRDVTERHRQQRAVEQSESRFRIIAETLPVSIVITRVSDSTILYANDEYCKLIGVQRGTAIGQRARSFLYDQDERQRIMNDVDEFGYAHGREVTIQRADGTVRSTVVAVTKMRMNDETTLLSVLQDITPIKDLKKQQAFLAAIVESAEESIVGKSLEGVILSWNRGAEKLYGYQAEEVIGRSIQILAPPEKADEILSLLKQLQQGQRVPPFETVRVTKAGRRVDVSLILSPIFDANGTVVSAVAITRDISEGKRADEALRFQAQLLNTVGQAVIATNMENKVTYWNHAAELLYGWSAAEAVGRSILDLTPADTSRDQAAQIMTRLHAGESWSGEFNLRGKDGRTFPVLVTDTPIIDAQGALQGVIGVSMDITERKRAAEAVQQSETLLRAVLAALPIGVVITDAKGQIMHHNPASQQIWAGAKYLGVDQYGEYKAWWLDSGKRIEADEWAAARAITTGETSLNEELEIERFDGVHRYMLNSAVPITNNSGDLAAVVVVNEDITERKRAELALHQYNQRLGILHRIDRGILAAQTPQRIAEMIAHSLTDLIPNDAIRIIGLDSDNALFPYLAAYPPASEESQALLKHAIERYGLPDSFHRGEALLIDDTKTDKSLWVGFESVLTAHGARSWVIIPLIVGEQLVGAFAVGSLRPLAFTSEHADIVREIADQLAIALHKARLDEQLEEHSRMLEARIAQRTEQLQAAKERIEAVLSSTSDAIVLAHLDGTIEQVNPAFTALFGVGLEPGQTVSLYSLLDSASADRLRHALAEIVTSGQAARMELTGIHQEGRLFHADAAFAPVINSLPALLIGSVRDISLYKQAEESLLAALAHEKEVNQLKTSFTSIVSHEFRTPLAVILSSTDLLAKYFDRMDQNRRQEKLENIARQVRRLIKLLDDVLTITRSESKGFELKPSTLNLVALCEELIEEVSVGHQQQVTFDISYQGDCRQVYADEFLFSHILQNLATNAVKYSNAGGRVRIALTCSVDTLTLRVEDQGIGIPLEHQSRLFEAFRRADNVGQIQGTGIGLTIVKRAVEAYNGTIEFESVEGQGTTFTVTLPASAQRAEGNSHEN